MNTTNQDSPTPEPPSGLEPFGNVVFSYSRKQAIEDGVLVDVSETAREAGFKWPFAMTAEVWALIEDIPSKYGYEDVQGRLWDILNVALFQIRASKQIGPELFFEVILHQRRANRLRLKLHCGPTDDGNPALTLMLSNQD